MFWVCVIFVYAVGVVLSYGRVKAHCADKGGLDNAGIAWSFALSWVMFGAGVVAYFVDNESSFLQFRNQSRRLTNRELIERYLKKGKEKDLRALMDAGFSKRYAKWSVEYDDLKKPEYDFEKKAPRSYSWR